MAKILLDKALKICLACVIPHVYLTVKHAICAFLSDQVPQLFAIQCDDPTLYNVLHELYEIGVD